MKKKNDVQLIVLSVILAIVMWAFVVTSTNPSVNRTFRNVPILVQNKDALEARGYTIIGLDEASNVNIRVEGTRAVSYTHLTLPTILRSCRSRWSPYH